MTLPDKWFVILTGTRTGSTVFWRTLDAHPQLEVHGEMFLDGVQSDHSYQKWREASEERLRFDVTDRRAAMEQYLKELLTPARAGSMAGFKLMVEHLPPELADILRERKPPIVYLIRRNSLKRRISQVAANNRGVFHVKSDDKAPRGKVTLDCSRLVQELRTRDGHVEGGLEFARSCGRTLEVYYEDMVADRDAVFRPVFEFLGVPPIQLPPPRYQKINPDSLSEIVENYDEVVDTLRGTEFEQHLD